MYRTEKNGVPNPDNTGNTSESEAEEGLEEDNCQTLTNIL